MTQNYDAIVVGGGIVGMATARELSARLGTGRVLVLEKESGLARHQSGHNSGVIHAGVYYPPASLKATLCRAGLVATMAYCEEHAVPYETRGKLIVALNEDEVQRMRQLAERARTNGVLLDELTASELRAEEASVVGEAALLVHETGIADYPALTRAIGAEIERAGARVRCGETVMAIDEGRASVTVRTTAARYEAPLLVCCAGLWADRLIRMAGRTPDFRIVPFRGSYFRLGSRLNQLVRRLIYPVPDPSQPFLGVHVTPMIDGSITVGPNASVAPSREAYRWRDVDLRDALGMAAFPGFWRMLAKNAGSAANELLLTLSRRRYLRAVQAYCPSIRDHDLVAYPAGLRAQAVDRRGNLIDDFLIRKSARAVFVCNAPSPAATSAFPIAERIVDKALDSTGDDNI
jgi:L-2-hydroxyglutarate oxidase